MIDPTMPFTPDETIAGRIMPAAGEAPLEAAYRAASRALDAERLCLAVVPDPDGRHVAYLAAPAAAFASQALATRSPLVMALPGAPGHRGPAVYSAPTPLGRCGIVLGEDGRMTAVAGDRASIADAAEIHGLALVEIDDAEDVQAPGDTIWTPHHRFVEARQERRDRLALVSGSVLAAFAGAAWLAFSWGAGVAGPSASVASPIGSAIAAPAVDYQALNSDASSAAATLRHFLEVSDLARQTKGLVTIYRVDNGATRFVLELPTWVTRQQIESLGPSKVSATAKGVLVDGRRS